MPLGTKWSVTFETTIPIGDQFIEGVISDGIGEDDTTEKPIAQNIKVVCLKELTDDEYAKHDEEIAERAEAAAVRRGII